MKKNWKEYVKACREYDEKANEMRKELDMFYNQHVYKDNEGKTILYGLTIIFVCMAGIGSMIGIPLAISKISDKLDEKKLRKEKEETKTVENLGFHC